jgi:alpha-mannosidase
MAIDATSGMDEILGRWRQEIKAKRRRIISLEETFELKIRSLKALIHPEVEPTGPWLIREFIYSRKRERAWLGDWRPIAVGERWGGPDRSALFRAELRLPERFAGRKVALKLYLGGDGLLSLDGRPYHGLDPFRDTIPMAEAARGGEAWSAEVESYIFWHFGESEIKTMECSHWATVDQEMSDAYWDFRAAWNALAAPDQDPALVEFLRAGLGEALWSVDQNEADPEKARSGALRARAILRGRVYDSGLFRKPGLMHLCGNSHLDVAFLWTRAEFVRKLGRTHATQLRLLEQFPDFTFSQSQALAYAEMKANYPGMFEEIKRQVRAGRWEVIGGAWVEPDCNLISGESMVRQFLHGIRWIERELGVTPRTCWCPDVFGNAWTMPQIIAKCGMEYFVTHKMGVWNDTNPWTKNTFWWQGPDGTRILSLMPPTHFIGTIEPDHLAKHWESFSDKGSVGESLYNFGWGDGGGGPDQEMLEYEKRYGSFPGLPSTSPNTIEGALDSIAAKARDAELPVVNDELYLEEHRGVLTTRGRLKRLNRRCEFLLRRAELWSAFSLRPYPRERLDGAWKEVLTSQFHDCLPGSHVRAVYEDLLEGYDMIVRTGEGLVDEAQAEIGERIDTRGPGAPAVVFNSLGAARATVASLETPRRDLHVLDPRGREVPHQFIEGLEGGTRLYFRVDLPGAGYAVYRLVEGPGEARFPSVFASAGKLENDLLSVDLNAEGEVAGLLRKDIGRQFIDPAKRGNVLRLYEDVPGKYEAWDIAPTYAKLAFPLPAAKAIPLFDGPLCAAVEVSRDFMGSRMVQRILLWQGAERVEFHTWVDWRERQKMLKVRFHTPLVARSATYDIAYGAIERSCCRNNSFEEARFEVPAHLWMDLSQPDRGLSLLNDCKYGHEAFDGMMALTLLRGPTNPDPDSDREEHRFAYALYPHAGTWREGTMAQALDLNEPAEARIAAAHGGSLPPVRSFIELDCPGATLEAVKLAEEGDDLIVRVVERNGADAELRLALDRAPAAAWDCDCLERGDRPLELEEGAVRATLRPFEIRSFKLRR